MHVLPYVDIDIECRVTLRVTCESIQITPDSCRPACTVSFDPATLISDQWLYIVMKMRSYTASAETE